MTQPDGTAITRDDPYLEPFVDMLRQRYQRYLATRTRITQDDQSIAGPISRGHEYFGFTRGKHEGQPGVWYREWAPQADYLSLIGDFNDWDRGVNPLTRGEFGHWSIFLPDEQYADRLTHDSRVKVHVAAPGYAMDRIPAYIKRVVQEPDSADYNGRYWQPPKPYRWRHKNPTLTRGIRIYEAHVGMAQEEGKVGSYPEFTQNNLPRIAELGYNAIQLMAVQEHPYYGSFGYHVSNLFAPSSRFGNPYELKQLIDKAHQLGLIVIMDIVHSHMVKNIAEGLNRFDGSDHQYFHPGPRGEHKAWDSLCYDYGQYEVLRLLLSNLRYWLEEYRFDGFRFDGVTSMLYHDHGLGKSFSTYDDYFGDNVEADAVTYLTLANELAHEVRPNCVTIAEDVSGMPGLARPIDEGGIGFDYRLAMGVPDYWIKLLKEKSDEQWNLGDVFHTLMNRRRTEKHVGYAESHDQALVGDKTLAFRLMDAAMYDQMSVLQESLVVDRGVALHKIIRLLTFSLAGEGYLNFMGNEFGHPEWIDFPREGNQNSYHYARRQWSLAEQDHLRYKGLQAFDRAMMQLDERFDLLSDPFIESLALHEDTRQMVYRRGPLVFAVNLHATESYADLRIPVPDAEDYRVVLDSDAAEFGGQGRIDPEATYLQQSTPMYGRAQTIQIYLPARTALVLAPRLQGK